MKKLATLAAILAFMALIISGCGEEGEAGELAYETGEVENVSISIENVSPTGAVIIITDTNKEPYIYGEWYAIEKEEDGKWLEVEIVLDNYGFNSMGYIPNKNGELKFEIDWEWLYGKLPTGNYRLLKEVGHQYIAAGFSVQ